MSIALDFEVRLSRQDDTAADVRIWVDADGNQQMDHGEEIRPLRRDGLVYRGSRTLELPSITGVGFLIRMQVRAGTRFRVRVWSNDGTSRELVYEEQDSSADGSHRIIGWCR
ncbi:MAG: hypothetical protein RIT45_20 [Pseudomonadota bacterium]|jgi:hypothetical protein